MMITLIVSPYDPLSQQKSKMILPLDLEDDHPWPETAGQQTGNISSARQVMIKGAQQMRNDTVRDASPTKPTAYQPALQSPGNLPPLLAAPCGLHLTFNVLRLQEVGILSRVVVTQSRYARPGHTDNTVHDRLFSPRRQKKNHVSNPQGAVAIRHNLHYFRFSQRGIHTGADISGEEYVPRSALVIDKMNTLQTHAHYEWINSRVGADLVPRREAGKRPASSACLQNQNGAHRLPVL